MGAMTDPSVIGASRWNRFGHDLTAVLFQGKFMFLFALMFGAGVVMFDRKTTPRGGARARLTDGAWLWHRRCFVLLGFGLLHAYLFWYGDILTWYAIAGLTLLWWVRRLPAHVQVWGGLGLFALGTLPLLALTLLGLWAESRGEVTKSDLIGSDAAEEIRAYLGSWADAARFRFFQTILMHLLFGPLFLPALWGIMIAGMGLTRLGVLTGERSLRFHATLGLVLTVTGLAVTLAVYAALRSSTELSGFVWQSTAQLVGMPLALGYAQLVVAAARLPAMAGVTRALANVGRMALTNYLLHTLICTSVMYGYGLGRYASVEYPALFGLVGAVWGVNLVFSTLWLRHFAYGPMEWLWRQATYLGFNTRSA